jgi:hypothetical protein
MNPPVIFLGAFILFVGIALEIDWYKKFGKFYYQENGGGSLFFLGTGLMALVAGLFMESLPEDIYEPIEIIKNGGHR